MIGFLNNIRMSRTNVSIKKKVRNTLLILLLGISLGIFSKWLDIRAFDSGIWWQNIIDSLELRTIFTLFGVWILLAVAISIYSSTPLRAGINVFAFFIGMNLSYHIYTIVFAGFNPRSYMMIWYTITMFSPILAAICWYAKGNGMLAILINAGIIAVMTLCSFNIGMWYFDYKSVIDTLMFLLLLGILYDTPKKSILSLIGGLILAFMIRLII